jgi:NADP-reducing hydrogenase subunit HndB
MPKITIAELNKIKERAKALTLVREGGARATVSVHMGACGIAAGARQVLKAFIREIESASVQDVIVTICDCAGQCSREPMVTVHFSGQPPVVYGNVTEPVAREIFTRHVMQGTVLASYRIQEGAER